MVVWQLVGGERKQRGLVQLGKAPVARENAALLGAPIEHSRRPHRHFRKIKTSAQLNEHARLDVCFSVDTKQTRYFFRNDAQISPGHETIEQL